MTAKRNFWSVGGKLCCLCIVLVPFAFAGPVKAKRTLTILPTGVAAISINDSGVVTGWEDSGLGFLRTPDGTITTFKAVDNAHSTQPQWINSSGVITGYYWDNNDVIRGFVRDAAGAITTFDAPGATGAKNSGTFPSSINAQGVVTGSCSDCQTGNGWVRAVDGTITSFDVPGAGAWGTTPTGVNDKGEIVGSYRQPADGLDRAHGFFRSADGNITTFDEPESHQITTADAVNNKGAITGSFSDANSAWRGYIRQPDGTFTTFDADMEGAAINAKGTIAGSARLAQPKTKGFVRYPSGKTIRISGPSANGGGTHATSINKDGVVVGYSETRPDHQFWYVHTGFIWTP